MSHPEQPARNPGQPASHPTQPEWLPHPSGPRRLKIPVVAVIAVLALLVGGLGGYLIGHGAPGQVDSRATGCRLAKQLQGEGDVASWDGLNDARVWDAQAVGPLLHAAALRHKSDEELGKVGDGLTSAIMRLDSKKYGSELDKAVRLCG